MKLSRVVLCVGRLPTPPGRGGLRDDHNASKRLCDFFTMPPGVLELHEREQFRREFPEGYLTTCITAVEAEGYTIGVWTWERAAQFSAALGNYTECQGFYDKIVQSQGRPTELALQSLLQAYSTAGLMKKTIRIIAAYNQYGVSLTTVSFLLLIKSLRYHAKYHTKRGVMGDTAKQANTAVLQLFALMIRKGNTPNEQVINTVLPLLGSFQQGLLLVEKFQQNMVLDHDLCSPVVYSFGTLSALLELCGIQGDLQNLHKVFSAGLAKVARPGDVLHSGTPFTRLPTFFCRTYCTQLQMNGRFRACLEILRKLVEAQGGVGAVEESFRSRFCVLYSKEMEKLAEMGARDTIKEHHKGAMALYSSLSKRVQASRVIQHAMYRIHLSIGDVTAANSFEKPQLRTVSRPVTSLRRTNEKTMIRRRNRP